MLDLLAKGFYYKEIAVRLGISINTVGKHCGNIYRKLDSDNAREAIWKGRYLPPPNSR